VRAVAARDPRVRLVRLERNFGLSSAIEAGLAHAAGQRLVVMDGDLQADPRDLPALLEPLDRVDCVCGYRANRRAGDGRLKVLSSRIANLFRTLLVGDSVRDAGCTYRAFRRETVARIKWFRGMHRFFPTLVRLEGHTVAEVPVNNRPRRHGVSKFGVWNRVFAVSYDVFAVRWMRSRVVPWRVAEAMPTASPPRADATPTP
jgi:glycosyltransferase involved in cell wall biosynthesis